MEERLYIFSFEEAIDLIYQDIGDDTELESLLNSIILTDMRDVIHHGGGSHPHSPKTLPHAAMGFGWTGTAAPLHYQIRRFPSSWKLKC